MKIFRIASCVLALLLVLSLISCEDEPIGADFETGTPPEEEYGLPLGTGKIEGTDVTWEFYGEDPTLYIKGTGAIPEDLIYSTEQGANGQPWAAYASGNNEYKASIKHVVVEEGVAGLSRMSFRNCTYLETVTLPSGMTRIPFDCFTDCVALRRVVAKGVTEIGENAFQGCKSLSSLTVSASLASVGEGAFFGAGTSASKFTLTLAGTREEWGVAREVLQIPDAQGVNALIGGALADPKFTSK